MVSIETQLTQKVYSAFQALGFQDQRAAATVKASDRPDFSDNQINQVCRKLSQLLQLVGLETPKLEKRNRLFVLIAFLLKPLLINHQRIDQKFSISHPLDY